MSNVPVRGLFGCEPDKYSTNLLNINPGSVNDFYGNATYNFPNQTQIDLTKNGIWGLDTGTISNGGIYIYLIGNSTTGDFGFIASKSITEGGLVCPSGYSFLRKLPWGINYNTSWDGIPNFHLTHWSMPFITYTDSEYASLWMPIAGGSASNWTDIDLSTWLPDNARLAYISAQIRYNSGSEGSGYLRSYSGQKTGQIIGSASPGSPYTGQSTFFLRTTSDRKIQYRTTGSVQLYLGVMGYCMSDPS